MTLVPFGFQEGLMRKFLAIALMALTLAGCQVGGDLQKFVGAAVGGLSAVVSYEVTQAQLDGARGGYNVAFLTPAAKYRKLTLCRTGQTFLRNGCAQRSHIVALQAADQEIAPVFDRLQGALDRGDKPGALALYRELEGLITSAKNLLAGFGINNA